MSAHINTISDREEIQHFSHEHPLIYSRDEYHRNLCSACGVALLSSPSYRCSQDCDFFLHQLCALLLPLFIDKFGIFSFYIKLLAEPPHENCKCRKCENLCTRFTYECSQWLFETFYLHCQCAFPLEITTKHISHPEHSLVALCKEASLVCDACGREQKGTFFSCLKCSFYIHQDCCLLPTIAKTDRHHHLLSLNYTLSRFDPSIKYCLICDNEVSWSTGAYICELCELQAHLHCVESRLEEPAIVEAFILPQKSDTFPSLIIRTLIKSREDSEIEEGESKIKKYHIDHSFQNLHHQESHIQLVCNACVQPIISPPLSHYSCPQSHCDFLLHKLCANLPPTVEDYYHGLTLHHFSKSSDFCSVFTCKRCRHMCNGFGYTYHYKYEIDVECAAAPTTIKHMSHSQHLLALSFTSDKKHLCCGRPIRRSYYCSVCDYYIHIPCAFLPKTVEHKFDEHPLYLIYDPKTQIPQKEDYLCEFCEEGVDPKFWFYHCGQCDQSFHVNCIPSTGELSKIKFGYNYDLPRHVHDHPMVLTRMLTMGSQRCGYCEGVIDGFVDDMAFHCSMCVFWLHFICAEQASEYDNN